VEKQEFGRTWQPVRPFPTPFIALHRRLAVWDGVGACANQKVSQKKQKMEKQDFGRTWQPVRPLPTPFVALHRRLSVRGRLGRDGVGACENQKVSQKKRRK
jgi:hypothetical protein